MRVKKKRRKTQHIQGSWFGARVLFECLCPEEKRVTPLFEEQVILVRARNERLARKRAFVLGKAAQHSYKNMHGKTVRWIFREVLDVKQLFDAHLKEGSEVYFDFLRVKEVNQIRRMFKR